MKVIYNNYIPFKEFTAINLFGIIFVRKGTEKLTQRIITHESIHTRQLLELFIIGFYIWYIVEWIIRWIFCGNRYTAYTNICFEREAYENDKNPAYLQNRPFWQFRKYLKK